MKISFGAYTLLTEGIPERVKHAILEIVDAAEQIAIFGTETHLN